MCIALWSMLHSSKLLLLLMLEFVSVRVGVGLGSQIVDFIEKRWRLDVYTVHFNYT